MMRLLLERNTAIIARDGTQDGTDFRTSNILERLNRAMATTISDATTPAFQELHNNVMRLQRQLPRRGPSVLD